MSGAAPARLAWTKSSRCDNADCVEVARTDRAVAVRDNTRPDVHLSFDHASWDSMLRALRAGELDR